MKKAKVGRVGWKTINRDHQGEEDLEERLLDESELLCNIVDRAIVRSESEP